MSAYTSKEASTGCTRASMGLVGACADAGLENTEAIPRTSATTNTYRISLVLLEPRNDKRVDC